MEEKANKIQFLEQNLEALFMQKQAYNMEKNELLLSLKELSTSLPESYKIVGQIMVKVPTERLKEEINNKLKIVENRVKFLESQEANLRKEIENLAQAKKEKKK